MEAGQPHPATKRTALPLRAAQPNGGRPMRLKDKVALITGVASGMGAAMARVFAREGARVAVADILDAEGQEVVSAITRSGGTARYLTLDVAEEAEWQAAIAAVTDSWGRLD